MTEENTKSISNPPILSLLPVAAVITNIKGELLEWNDLFFKLIGFPSLAVEAESITEIFDFEGNDLKNLISPLLSGEEQSVEVESTYILNKIPVTLNLGLFSNQMSRSKKLIWLIKESAPDNHLPEYFQLLFQSIPFGIVISDGHDNVLKCNRAFEDLFGYTKAQLKGKKINDMIVPDSMKDFGVHLTSNVAEGRDVFHETLRVRADGELINVAVITRPVVFSNNRKYIFSIYQDVTDREKIKKLSLENGNQFATMLNYLPGIVYRCKAERDYPMLFVSEGSLKITGYEPGLFMNHSINYNEIIHEKFRDFVWEKWQKAIEDNKVFQEEYCIKHRDGEIRWVWERGHVVRDNHNRIMYLEGYIEDITEQRSVRLSLIKEKELLQALMDNIPDTIYFKDRNSRFLQINKAQAQVLGVKNQADAVGKTDNDFFDAVFARKTFEEEQEMMVTGELVINNEEHVFTNMGWRWLSTTKVPLYDENGEITGLVGVSRDITTNKVLENKLRKSERDLTLLNQEKDKLFSVIAHDMRSPFNSFLLLTELLADKSFSVEKEELVQLAKSMHQSAAAVAELLENLLEWSRIQRGQIVYKPKTVVLKNILEKNLNYFQANLQKKNIHVELSVADKITVLADSSMLSSVIRNLISNAIKFTPGKGTIRISAKRPDNNSVLFMIQDSGIGMDAEQQEKLFTFDTRGTKGTEDEPSSGLGLILVREFIKIMKGRIYLTSKENFGTTFYVELPAH